MGKGARAIITDQGHILVVHRIKNGKVYYVLPGGAIEKCESAEEACIREAKEETNFDVVIDRLLWKYIDPYNNIEAYYFLIKSFKGELKFIGPELEKANDDDQYILEWIPLQELDKILLYPEEIKERILKEFLNS